MSHKKSLFVLYSHNPSRLAHLEKLKSLKNTFHIVLISNSSPAPSWTQQYIDESYVADPYLAHNTTLLENFKVRFPQKPYAILNLSEACVPLHAALVNTYELPGPSMEQALLGRDKILMRRVCQDIGLSVPSFEEISLDDFKNITKLKAPWIIKPSIGGGSTLVKRFNSIQELQGAILNFDQLAKKQYQKDILFQHALNKKGNFRFIAEEDIGGTTQFNTQFPYNVGEISVESFHFGNEAKIIAIHDKPIPGDNNPYFEEHLWSTPTRIPPILRAQVEEQMQKIHAFLGPECHVLHTEFRTLNDKVMLLEFGIRMGGGPIYSSVLKSTQFDFIDALIERGHGKTLQNNQTESTPVITHSLWSQAGILKEVKGEGDITQLPFYQSHQIYDKSGDTLLRAPVSSRGHGHIVFSGSNFHDLENSCFKALQSLKFILSEERQYP
ncbi:MAG: ATP-grasp domain-containing protein [Bdellovibrionota bacterium]